MRRCATTDFTGANYTRRKRRGHEQYAGRLTLDQQLHYVRQGHGRSCVNRDYVLDTVKEIEGQGTRDGPLHLLAERLKGGTEKVG